ncbi:MAG: DNA-directed DNA polymerase [Burkholderiales bacterium]
MALRSLYVDFNSYFASVEQQLRPELRGKPIGVLPVMADTTCCVAASYEAKKYGVKTGTIVAEAKKMCKDMIFVEARPAVYVEMHHMLIELVESCTPVERVNSIDEMQCELTGSQQQRDKAVALAHKIKQTITEKAGSEMRCSVGIATNPFLAKTATDMQKPNGLVVIEQQDLPHCLHRLKLRDLCGVGRMMEERLIKSGIVTVEQLCAASKHELYKAWGGIEGERMYQKLRGEIVFSPPTQKASVGHSHVLSPDMRSELTAFSVLNKMLQKAAMRLRAYSYTTSCMHAVIKYTNGQRWEDAANFDATDDTLHLINALDALWQRRKKICGTPLAVGITFTGLNEKKYQSSSLFDELKSHDALNAAVDKLNLRYGSNTVYYGGSHLALQQGSAPMRIAFNHIPDLVVESDGQQK